MMMMMIMMMWLTLYLQLIIQATLIINELLGDQRNLLVNVITKPCFIRVTKQYNTEEM